ncbi:MAG: hypothetical protein ABS911_09595 [Carnobacterium sp.]|uniref:hypothetical protein n=1 Tax=Carnobacterium sp. TaxID=48221 RepID=UPI00331564D4
MINKKNAVFALTSVLLVGCGSNKETKANEPELQESTSSVVEDTKDIKEEVTEAELPMEFSTTLDPTDILDEQQYMSGSDIDPETLPEYDMYADMMAELSDLFVTNYDTDKIYNAKYDDNYSFRPTFQIDPLDYSTGLALSVYEDVSAYGISAGGSVGVSTKTSPTGSKVYANNEVFDNGGITEEGYGNSTYIVYENDEVFVYISNLLIDRTMDENPFGDDLNELFTSDEAMAIYEKYIK